MVSIGIDLGSTTSGVAVIRDNRCVKIPLMDGNVLMPSVLYFDPEGPIVMGAEAVDQIVCNPQSTVYDTKVILGRMTSDPIVQQFAKNVTFNVILNEDRPKIRINQNGRMKHVTPEQIAHLILKKLKAYASEYLQQSITKVVVTVPAFFNHSQRDATRKACEMAQLPNCELLNEPSAAIFGYHSEVSLRNGSNLLVFDLGGGTFDLSLLKKEHDIFVVIRTLGDTALGGRDFDHCLVRYCMESFSNQNEHRVNSSECKLSCLRTACEMAKIRLSSINSTRIVVEKFWKQTGLHVEITREQFEAMIDPLCKKMHSLVLQILQDASMSPKDIDRVFPIGGSIRVPKVRRILDQLFSITQICENLNPETAVLTGAARYADGFKNCVQPVLHDVISQGLGISTSKGEMAFFIPPDTPLPFTTTRYVQPHVKYAQYITIDFFEGRSLIARENTLIHQFQMPLSITDGRIPLVEIKLGVDSQGIVDVIATEVGTGRKLTEIGIRCQQSVCDEHSLHHRQTAFLN